MELPLTGVQLLTEWSPGYQFVHQVFGAICSAGALSVHVSCMQLLLETLTLTGLSVPKNYLLVLRLNALYTPPAWIPRVSGPSPITDV